MTRPTIRDVIKGLNLNAVDENPVLRVMTTHIHKDINAA